MKTDITNLDDVRILVDSFYRRAAKDDLIGPIFSHLPDVSTQRNALYTYWQTALLSEQEDCYAFPQHIELMFSHQHFIRWLTLFLETIDFLYCGSNANKAKVIIIRKSEEFQTSLHLLRF